MISALVLVGMLLGAILIMGMGLLFSLLAILFMNTGRSMTYDRAARTMARASDTSKAEKKAEKAAKKAEKAAEKDA